MEPSGQQRKRRFPYDVVCHNRGRRHLEMQSRGGCVEICIRMQNAPTAVDQESFEMSRNVIDVCVQW